MLKSSMEALKKGSPDGGTVDKTQGVSAERIRRRMLNVFTILSALATIIVGVVIGVKIADAVTRQMQEAYATATATQVKGLVSSYVTDEDLTAPFVGKKYDDFYNYVNKAIFKTNVVKVKLWRLDSTVLFSNDPKIVGKQFKTKDPLQKALDGEAYWAVTDLKADENVEERNSGFNRLLEMYFPVYTDTKDEDRVTAVYEVYMTMAPLQEHVQAVTRDLGIGLGILVLLLVIIAEIASQMLRKRNQKLHQLSLMLEMKADTDGLTGLYNHRHFQNFLEREISRSLRYNEPLSLLIVDLDFFKSVNDRFGHQAGDEVLRRVAGIFDHVLRTVDYAARYGGEEFVAVLPGTDAKGAIALAERLRETAENLVVDVASGSGRPKVSLSCGVADFPSCASERESLIAAADSALLFAKRKGRNRVCYFRDITGADIQEGDLDKLVSRLQNASMPTIQALVAAVDTRDSYDRTRSRNVASLANRFAASLGLEENMSHALALAAQVHDIGKITVPERVLGKSEPLSESEMDAIRTHPEASARIIESASQIESLLSAVLHHHENWDGTGYPNGLKAEEIPYLARMLRILDAYEAMVSDRPYRAALTSDEAIAQLRQSAGKDFDPQMVEQFIASNLRHEPTPANKDLSGEAGAEDASDAAPLASS